LTCHRGEIERNPYHLRLPAWMMDNVRRGSEIIQNKETSTPDFAFGSLYEWQLIKKGKKKKITLPSYSLSRLCDLGSLITDLF
jgi:hypothetical protein